MVERKKKIEEEENRGIKILIENLEQFECTTPLYFRNLNNEDNVVEPSHLATLGSPLDCAAAEPLIQFAAQHFIKVEAMRQFPNLLDVSWFQDANAQKWFALQVGNDTSGASNETLTMFSEHGADIL